MRIDGAWRLGDDGIVRPVLRAEVRSAAGNWLPIHFLVDVGADRATVAGICTQVPVNSQLQDAA